MILVSILGDFHSSVLPIFYKFKDRITNHIIIYDDFKYDQQEAKNIIKGTTNFIKKYELPIKTDAIVINEDSLLQIKKITEYIKQNFKDLSTVYINITDGLSNISTVIAMELLPLGVKFISYDRYDNEYNLLDKDNMKSFKLKSSISIEDHFLLKNIEYEDTTDYDYIETHSKSIKKIFKDHHKSLIQLKNYLTVPYFNGSKSSFYEAKKIIEDELGLDLERDKNFITGGLFESYIYLILKEMDVDDIALNPVITKFYTEEKMVKNEFDVLVMKENHLHMIECKFRSAKRLNLDELVYKYIAIKPFIDDDAKMSIVTLLSQTDSPFASITSRINHTRAMANRLQVFSNPFKNIDLFKKEIKEWLEI